MIVFWFLFTPSLLRARRSTRRLVQTIRCARALREFRNPLAGDALSHLSSEPLDGTARFVAPVYTDQNTSTDDGDDANVRVFVRNAAERAQSLLSMLYKYRSLLSTHSRSASATRGVAIALWNLGAGAA